MAGGMRDGRVRISSISQRAEGEGDTAEVFCCPKTGEVLNNDGIGTKRYWGPVATKGDAETSEGLECF